MCDNHCKIPERKPCHHSSNECEDPLLAIVESSISNSQKAELVKRILSDKECGERHESKELHFHEKIHRKLTHEFDQQVEVQMNCCESHLVPKNDAYFLTVAFILLERMQKSCCESRCHVKECGEVVIGDFVFNILSVGHDGDFTFSARNVCNGQSFSFAMNDHHFVETSKDVCVGSSYSEETRCETSSRECDSSSRECESSSRECSAGYSSPGMVQLGRSEFEAIVGDNCCDPCGCEDPKLYVVEGH